MFRTVYSVVYEWLLLVPNHLDYWPFGILTEKAVLRTPPLEKTIKLVYIAGNECESSFLLSASLDTQGE